MANVFKPKRSNTASSVPTTSDIVDGELAVNSADQKIYIRDSSSILEIGDVSPWKTSGYTGIGTTSTVGIGTRIEIIPYDTQNGGTLSFEGSAGQLFSISNNLTSGSIFSVNDVSGIPSIDVDADGTIQLAPIGATEFVGIGTTNPIAKLDVNGNVNVSGVVTATSFAGIASTATTVVATLDSTTGSAYKIPYLNTTSNSSGNYELLLESGGFTYQPSSNTFTVSNISVTQLSVSERISLSDGDEIRIGSSNDAKVFYDGTANDLEIELEATANKIAITDNGTYKHLITRDGKVGINTSVTPTDALDVNGNVNVSGVVTATSFVKSGGGSGFLLADGTEDTNTYNNYSHPNHSGDVTSTGDGATTIANNAVTHAKYQQVATDTIIGRTASGTGNVTALSKSDVLTILNVEDGADVTDATNVASAGAVMDGDFTSNGFMKRTAAGTYTVDTSTYNNYSHPNHSGDVTSNGDGATTIADDAVTYGKMQNLVTGNRVLGGTTAGLIGEVQIATDMVADDAVTYTKMQNLVTANRVLGGTAAAGAIGEVQIATDMVSDDAITYAKIQNVSATDRILGRDSAGAGIIEEITPANVRTMLNVEDGADVTDATNVDAAGAVMESDTSTVNMSFVVDEDNMASNSATKVPTQQSVKAYVDNNVGIASVFEDSTPRLGGNLDLNSKIITGTGRIGIGTTNALATIDIDGVIRQELHSPAMLVGLNDDIGKEWTKVEMGSGIEQIHALTYCGNGIVLAGSGNGTSDGDIYRSTDFGKTFIKVEMDTASSPTASLESIRSIVYCGNGIVIAGSGDSSDDGDFYRSTDYGVNWTRVYNTTLGLEMIYSLVYCGNGIVLGGGGFSTGDGDIFRSTDFGVSWTRIFNSTVHETVRSLVYCGNGIALAGMSNDTDDGDIYRSTDFGLTWTQVEMGSTLEQIDSLVYCGNGIVLAGGGFATGDGDIYRSTDYGQNFTKIEMGSSLESIVSLVYCGNGIVLAGSGFQPGDGDIYRSSDFGLTWTQIEMGADLERIISLVYCGNGIVLAGAGNGAGDGDIYRSDVGFSQASTIQGISHEHLTGNIGIGSIGSTGEVKLHHNGSEKLKTSSTGVSITGSVTATSASLAAGHIILNNSGASIVGACTATSFVKSGGTSSQYLMADGSTSTGGGGASEAFKTISVSGQSDVVADSATDTLTLVAGSNMTITTNASGDSITFASSGGGGGGSSALTTLAFLNS